MTLHVENLDDLPERIQRYDKSVVEIQEVFGDGKPHKVTYWYSPGIQKTEEMILKDTQRRFFRLCDSETGILCHILHVADILEVT